MSTLTIIAYLKKLIALSESKLIISTVLTFISTYIFNDYNFLIFVIVLILIDTITGFYKNYIKRNIQSKKFGDVITKMIVYFTFLIVIHILTNFQANNETVTIFAWITNLAYSLIVVRESISILENLNEISPNLIPLNFIKRLSNYIDNKVDKKINNENDKEINS